MCSGASLFLGTTSIPSKPHRVVLADVAETYASGDVIGTLKELNCAVLVPGGLAKVLQVRVYEQSPPGTQVKAPLRLHFFKKPYTPPAQGAPFKAYQTATEYLGNIDVASGDYIEVGDGIGTDPDWAFAKVSLESAGMFLRAEENFSKVWMLAEVRDAAVYTGAATLTIEIETIQY